MPAKWHTQWQRIGQVFPLRLAIRLSCRYYGYQGSMARMRSFILHSLGITKLRERKPAWQENLGKKGKCGRSRNKKMKNLPYDCASICCESLAYRQRSVWASLLGDCQVIQAVPLDASAKPTGSRCGGRNISRVSCLWKTRESTLVFRWEHDRKNRLT